MSGLTVKTCFEMFPQMKAKDMAKLLGTENFTENTPIKAARVAKYNGTCAEEISVFYAQNDTKEFVPLLDGAKQKSVMTRAGVEPEKVPGLSQDDNANKQQFAMSGNIPMNTSVFDIYNKRQFA